jgi:hypothetical protein
MTDTAKKKEIEALAKRLAGKRSGNGLAPRTRTEADRQKEIAALAARFRGDRPDQTPSSPAEPTAANGREGAFHRQAEAARGRAQEAFGRHETAVKQAQNVLKRNQGR